VTMLKQAWTQDEINIDSEFYQFKNLTTAPAKPYQHNAGHYCISVGTVRQHSIYVANTAMYI